MKFEEVISALREGKKVRRNSQPGFFKLGANGYPLVDEEDDIVDLSISSTSDSIFHCDDWEILPEPKTVAEYVVIVASRAKAGCNHVIHDWEQRTYNLGEQPPHAVLIPGTERLENE